MTKALPRAAHSALAGAICVATLYVASFNPLHAETPAYYETIQYIGCDDDCALEASGKSAIATSAFAAVSNYCRNLTRRLIGSRPATPASDEGFITVARAEDASSLRIISGPQPDGQVPARTRF
jgi:hypothetical protein